MNNYYISHGGPGSGRYPLGSGERPYQGRYEIKKSLRRLNVANNRKETHQANKRFNKKIQETFPRMTKPLKPLIRMNDKLDDAAIKYYSKKFEEQLQKFKDSGIDLDVKNITKIKAYPSNNATIIFKGNKYYLNGGD